MTDCRGRWSLWLVLVVFVLAVPGVGNVAAQQDAPPETIRACYVPGSGNMYRIGVQGLPSSCNSKAHTEFVWNVMGPAGPQGPEGPPGPSGSGVTAHSELQGLGADDHPQYLLLGGVRDSNSGFAVTGTFPSDAPLPVSGFGTRMLWYPARAAFRAGRVEGDQWNLENLGTHSVALGFNTTASGSSSAAFGAVTTASGGGSAAFGSLTTASGAVSTAFGVQTTASGNFSAAFGDQTVAQAQASFVIGRNDVIAGNPVSWVETDPLFVAGNGAGNAIRSNALTLYKNGNLEIAGTLTESSDARLKEEIEPLEGVLDRVLRLQPVTYRFREGVNRSREKQIGLLAQDVAEEFPELVKTEADGYLSLSYTQLTAVLLQALREQEHRHQAELAEQAAHIAALEQRHAAQLAAQAEAHGAQLAAQAEAHAAELAAQEERVAALESRLAELERLLAQQVTAAAGASAPARNAAGSGAR